VDDCKRFEKNLDDEIIKWILDSGASLSFSSIVSDFSDLIYYKPEGRPLVKTANSTAEILGFGTVFIQTNLDEDRQITRIHPVMYLPNMSDRLLSMGQILHGNLRVHGDVNTLTTPMALPMK